MSRVQHKWLVIGVGMSLVMASEGAILWLAVL